MSSIPGPCPTSDDLKYTMTRLAVDGADIYIVEHGCATNIKVSTSIFLGLNIYFSLSLLIKSSFPEIQHIFVTGHIPECHKTFEFNFPVLTPLYSVRYY